MELCKTREIGFEEANWLLRGNDEAQGFKSIFNGKDLSGWYTYLANHGKNNDPDRVFTVEDGVQPLPALLEEEDEEEDEPAACW